MKGTETSIGKEVGHIQGLEYPAAFLSRYRNGFATQPQDHIYISMHHLPQLEVDEELRMRRMLLILLLSAACVAALLNDATDVATATDTLAQNFTEHSWVFVNGYMDESRVLQTQAGFNGQKIVLGASGSGMATRTIDSEVYRDSNMDEASLTTAVNFDYKPYIPPLTQNDLRNALCAKNYEVGSSFSETYQIDKDLIKDTKIYQSDNFSVYDISSEIQGTARIGQRVQKNAKTVPSFMMGGTYMGYAQIRSETVVGNASVLTLPCP